MCLLLGTVTVRQLTSLLKAGLPHIPAELNIKSRRPKNSMGTHPVSDSLRLHVSGARPSADRGESMEYEGADAPGGADAGGSAPAAPKPEELGNSRGKRMAMKFVNKIASKEKYTQVGCPHDAEFAGSNPNLKPRYSVAGRQECFLEHISEYSARHL